MLDAECGVSSILRARTPEAIGRFMLNECVRVRDGSWCPLLSVRTPYGLDQCRPCTCCCSLASRPFNLDSDQNPTMLRSSWDFGLSHGQKSEPRE